LQNSRRGCFIATAAYGYYSAPEVQALREFRDQYLLTNRAGSAFVRWYYEYGPVAAAYLDAHPGYKPVVRTALMPAVGLALFMTGTSFFIKAVVGVLMLIIALMIANTFFRKRLSGSGGT
jgi:ABC-type dipeptide/oligopeptide/nickel transport system permease component